MKKKKIYWCKHACKSYKISTSRRITYAKKAWDPNSSILVSSTLLFKRDQEFESLLRNREKRDLKLIQISMQIRNKKGRTISFQWCMEISTQRLLKHSTAQLTWSINIKASEFQSSKGTNYTFRVLCLNFQPKKLYRICINLFSCSEELSVDQAARYNSWKEQQKVPVFLSTPRQVLAWWVFQPQQPPHRAYACTHHLQNQP